MKKNLILMTALFAGTMLINDGVCRSGSALAHSATSQSAPINDDANPQQAQTNEIHVAAAPVETVREPNYHEQLAETRGELENTKKECEDLKKQLSIGNHSMKKMHIQFLLILFSFLLTKIKK